MAHMERAVAHGKAEGMAEGKASAVIDVLNVRNGSTTAAQKQRILSCIDVTVLDRRTPKTVTASRIEELFDDDSRFLIA